MSLYTILCVDDEINILKSLKRLFFDEKSITVLTAVGAKEGAEILKAQPVDLVLSDERMPQVQGSDFLRFVKQHFPNTVRIILTGYSDNKAILKAVNEGEVYRYLIKPWNDEELIMVIKNALEYGKLRKENERLNMKVVKQNNQLKNMNEKLEQMVTLRTNQLQQALVSLKEIHGETKINLAQTIELLANVVSTYNRELGSHSRRVANMVKNISQTMNRTDSSLGFQAALLSRIGTTDRDITVNYSTQMSAKLLGGLYGLKEIAAIIDSINENFNGTGIPAGLNGENIPFYSRLIRLAGDYDALFLQNNQDAAVALAVLRKSNYVNYDPNLFAAFEKMIQPSGRSVQNKIIKIPVENLYEGCRLASCIIMQNNVTLIPEETIITSEMVLKLKKFKDHLSKNEVRIYGVTNEDSGENNG